MSDLASCLVSVVKVRREPKLRPHLRVMAWDKSGSDLLGQHSQFSHRAHGIHGRGEEAGQCPLVPVVHRIHRVGGQQDGAIVGKGHEDGLVTKRMSRGENRLKDTVAE